ncbi:MAG: hypothetical protein KAH20_09725, partial [Methylococcales bacterium]|nr:hypothetical protein [Methylococcales bacterium]
MFIKKVSLSKIILLTVYLTIFSIPSNAQEKIIEEAENPISKPATQEEDKSLFDWAMLYLKINGREVAYKAFNQVDGKFTDRDLYVFCLDYSK